MWVSPAKAPSRSTRIIPAPRFVYAFAPVGAAGELFEKTPSRTSRVRGCATILGCYGRACAMPVYLLDRSDTFPPATHAEANGLLAVGGDLRPSRLLRAYSEGIFPWYSQGEPILWFSPDPRTVIDTSRMRIGRGMRRTLTTAASLTLTMDTAFS